MDYLAEHDVSLLYCYNIKFDNVFLIDFFIDNKIQFHIIESNQSQLGLSFEYKEKRITIKDFFAFARSSLDDFCKRMKTQTKKYPSLIDNEWDEFFRNCSIDELKTHCEHDVRMLSESIFIFRNLIFDEFNVDCLSKKIFSLASLAMVLFRTNYIEKNIDNSFLFTKNKKFEYELNEKLFAFVRDSYSGGYSDVFDNKLHQNVVSYDINSSYPFQTTKIKFPTGYAYYTTNYELFKSKTTEIFGFCRVLVNFEKDKAYIPVKFEGKFGRVFGKWSGVITSAELRYLQEKKVNFEFVEGYYFTEFDESCSLMNYCVNMYEKKQKESQDSPMREIYKILLNALTGKFGQNPFSTQYNYQIIERNEMYEISESYEQVFERNEHIVIRFSSERTSFKNFMMVSWISLITALARIQLLEMIEKVHAICCDTDSVYFINENLPMDFNFREKEFGGWKKEKEFLEFRALAPKMYAGMTKKNEIIVKCKGIPKRYRDEKLYNQIINWQEGQTVKVKSIHKFMGFKEALHSKNAKYSSSNIIKATYIDKLMLPVLKKPIDIELYYEEKSQEYIRNAEHELMKNRKHLKKKRYSNKRASKEQQFIKLKDEFHELFDDFTPLDIDERLTIEENAEMLRERIKDELWR